MSKKTMSMCSMCDKEYDHRKEKNMGKDPICLKCQTKYNLK